MIAIQTFTPKTHYIKCMIYGSSGVGKTVFACSAPDVIVASAEDGLLSASSMLNKEIPYMRIQSLDNLRELLGHLKKGKHNYKTLVIDSITEINEIIKEDIEEKSNKQMTLADWWYLQKTIKKILRSFKDLPMHVIIIAQEKIERDEEKVAKIVPLLNGRSATEIAYMMDIVWYAYIDKNGDHHISTSPNGKTLSKDRTGKLGHDAPLQFAQREEILTSINLDPNEPEAIGTLTSTPLLTQEKSKNTKSTKVTTKKKNE